MKEFVINLTPIEKKIEHIKKIENIKGLMA